MFLRMDGTRLAFRDESFAVAYSLSSIEHFGMLLKHDGSIFTSVFVCLEKS